MEWRLVILVSFPSVSESVSRDHTRIGKGIYKGTKSGVAKQTRVCCDMQLRLVGTQHRSIHLEDYISALQLFTKCNYCLL